MYQVGFDLFDHGNQELLHSVASELKKNLGGGVKMGARVAGAVAGKAGAVAGKAGAAAGAGAVRIKSRLGRRGEEEEGEEGEPAPHEGAPSPREAEAEARVAAAEARVAALEAEVGELRRQHALEKVRPRARVLRRAPAPRLAPSAPPRP